MEEKRKRRYRVSVEHVLHYNTGEVFRKKIRIEYTYATSAKKAVSNIRSRNRKKPIVESLYGPAISENYYAELA